MASSVDVAAGCCCCCWDVELGIELDWRLVAALTIWHRNHYQNSKLRAASRHTNKQMGSPPKVNETEERIRQLEAELAAAFVPVADCINGRPVSSVRLVPAWGDPGVPASERSTKTNKANWLDFDNRNVQKWSQEDFIVHLSSADADSLATLLAGKAGPDMQTILRGDQFASPGKVEHALKSEAFVQRALDDTVGRVLQTVMGNTDLKHHPLGAQLGCGFQPEPTFVTGIPPFQATHKPDRVVELIPPGLNVPKMRGEWLDASGQPTKDPEEWVDVTKWISDIVKATSIALVEIKKDSILPIPKQGNPTLDAIISGHLVDYLTATTVEGTKEEALLKAVQRDFNPASQLGSYAAVMRVSYVILTSYNRTAYGRYSVVPVSPNEYPSYIQTKHMLELTDFFDWTAHGDPLRPQKWSHYEILFRFLLAGLGTWEATGVPDTLKARAKDKMELKLLEQGGQGKGDDKGPGDQGSGSAGPKSGSSPRITGSQTPRKDRAESVSLSFSGNAVDSFSGDVSFKRPFWADLWAPLRFAIPSTHPPAIEGSRVFLEGDAVQIARGRYGPLYRKTLQGQDAIVKVLAFTLDREAKDDPSPTDLRLELEQEARIYRKLGDLQGIMIPKLLWYGEIVEALIDALVTEFAGTQLPTNCPLEFKSAAMDVLDAVHARGVLHGDIARRNLVVGNDGRPRLLDFGLAVFRGDAEDNDETWRMRQLEEREKLRIELSHEAGEGGRAA